ncbi:MAG: OmpA family protein [Kofleriaceae bacterium]|nr:OmpA family protein [Kofleriaceae bacterium]
MFRQSYDTTGVYMLDGARLMPVRDISWKVLVSYAQSPLDVAVPGIGPDRGDTGRDSVLGTTATVDMAFAMTLSKWFGFGFNVAAFRTSTAAGYGSRARYSAAGPVGKSTGLIALRPLSNIDPSGGYLDDGLAGPLDVRLGGKFRLYAGQLTAISFLSTVSLPFGEDEMLLGDSTMVFEPKLAIDRRLDAVRATRIVANIGARFRQRTVLESYDTQNPTETVDDAKAFLDVGSELIAGLGAQFEATPRAVIGAEVQAFIPLPGAVSYGSCSLYSGAKCASLQSSDYFANAKSGDFTLLANMGLTLRVNASVSAQLMIGAGAVGARGDDFRVSTGVVWSPQLAGVGELGRADRDGDGIPDGSDGCKDEPEDRDGYQDNDGCPDLDNDGDGIADAIDRCPAQAEDRDGFQDDDGCPDADNDTDAIADNIDRCPNAKEDGDGFEDDDGCPDDDNDGDGFADANDKCPNDPETINNLDDDDGCPDSKGSGGVEDRNDRIDLKGAQVSFRGNALTPAGKQLLAQVAAIINDKKLMIRVEVHVPLSTKSKTVPAITAARKKDKELALRRALAIKDHLASQGVPVAQLQAVGIGSDRPLDSSVATDAVNERVDFMKVQPRTP